MTPQDHGCTHFVSQGMRMSGSRQMYTQWSHLDDQRVRAELGAVSKGEKDERKAFQVACSVLGEKAGSVGSHMG